MTDYMKEAERLLDEYQLQVSAVAESRDAKAWLEHRTATHLALQARSALLAHIQRGAVPEGWQVVPIDPPPGMLDAAEAVDWGDVQRMLEFARDTSRKVTSWPDRLTGEAEAALRGEVKP